MILLVIIAGVSVGLTLILNGHQETGTPILVASFTMLTALASRLMRRLLFLQSEDQAQTQAGISRQGRQGDSPELVRGRVSPRTGDLHGAITASL